MPLYSASESESEYYRQPQYGGGGIWTNKQGKLTGFGKVSSVAIPAITRIGGTVLSAVTGIPGLGEVGGELGKGLVQGIAGGAARSANGFTDSMENAQVSQGQAMGLAMIGDKVGGLAGGFAGGMMGHKSSTKAVDPTVTPTITPTAAPFATSPAMMPSMLPPVPGAFGAQPAQMGGSSLWMNNTLSGGYRFAAGGGTKPKKPATQPVDTTPKDLLHDPEHTIDPRAREILSDLFPDVQGEQKRRLYSLHQISGSPDINSLNESNSVAGPGRAFFLPETEHPGGMYIKSGRGDDYIAELPHAYQHHNRGINQYGEPTPTTLNRAEPDAQKKYDEVEYDRPGSIENQAHSVIEPDFARTLGFEKAVPFGQLPSRLPGQPIPQKSPADYMTPEVKKRYLARLFHGNLSGKVYDYPSYASGGLTYFRAGGPNPRRPLTATVSASTTATNRPINPMQIARTLPQVTVTGQRNNNPLEAAGAKIGGEYVARLKADPRYKTSPWSVGSPTDIVDPLINYPGQVLDHATRTSQNAVLKPSTVVDALTMADMKAPVAAAVAGGALLKKATPLIKQVGRKIDNPALEAGLKASRELGVKNGWSDEQIARHQFENHGITENQRKAYVPVVSNVMANYVKPYGYNGLGNIGKVDKKDPYFADRLNAWNMYLGMPQTDKNAIGKKTFTYTGQENGEDVLRLDNFVPPYLTRTDIAKLNNQDINAITRVDDVTPVLHPGKQASAGVMGHYGIYNQGEGNYKYRDRWDLEPTVMGRKIPVEKIIGKPFISQGNMVLRRNYDLDTNLPPAWFERSYATGGPTHRPVVRYAYGGLSGTVEHPQNATIYDKNSKAEDLVMVDKKTGEKYGEMRYHEYILPQDKTLAAGHIMDTDATDRVKKHALGTLLYKQLSEKPVNEPKRTAKAKYSFGGLPVSTFHNTTPANPFTPGFALPQQGLTPPVEAPNLGFFSRLFNRSKRTAYRQIADQNAQSLVWQNKLATGQASAFPMGQQTYTGAAPLSFGGQLFAGGGLSTPNLFRPGGTTRPNDNIELARLKSELASTINPFRKTALRGEIESLMAKINKPAATKTTPAKSNKTYDVMAASRRTGLPGSQTAMMDFAAGMNSGGYGHVRAIPKTNEAAATPAARTAAAPVSTSAPRRRSSTATGGRTSRIATQPTVVSAADQAAYTHAVKPGDTLDQVARRYRTTTYDLMRMNGIKDPNKIQAGTDLYLKDPRPAIPAASALTPHSTIKPLEGHANALPTTLPAGPIAGTDPVATTTTPKVNPLAGLGSSLATGIADIGRLAAGVGLASTKVDSPTIPGRWLNYVAEVEGRKNQGLSPEEMAGANNSIRNNYAQGVSALGMMTGGGASPGVTLSGLTNLGLQRGQQTQNLLIADAARREQNFGRYGAVTGQTAGMESAIQNDKIGRQAATQAIGNQLVASTLQNAENRAIFGKSQPLYDRLLGAQAQSIEESNATQKAMRLANIKRSYAQG